MVPLLFNAEVEASRPTTDAWRCGCLIILSAIYVPTFHRLFSYGWKQADYTHGPLILVVFLWLIWKKRDVLSLPIDASPCWGSFAMLVLGLLLYVVGAINHVLMFEAGSIIPVLLAVAGLLYGRTAQWALVFPAMFLLFLVPPPIFFIDLATSPLKRLVAAASIPVLEMLGYPVVRNGVLLLVGDYSLVIGDACSGLRSLVSLLAVGALYAWPRRCSVTRRSLLLLSMIPISIVANITRLVLLAVVTYHLGDSAGQRLFHDYSGFFLFLFSVLGLVVVDAIWGGGQPVEARG